MSGTKVISAAHNAKVKNSRDTAFAPGPVCLLNSRFDVAFLVQQTQARG
jgi:hypothetical protein